MKMMLKKAALVMAALLGTASATAMPILVDNFNDDSTTGWTDETGSFNEATGLFWGSSISLATMDGQSGSALAVDAINIGNSGYVALVLNFSSLTDNLFVKIQDNDGNGLFDRVFFYHGNNGNNSFNGLVGPSYFNLTSEVSTTYFEAKDNGDGTVTAMVGATGDVFGGTLSHSYNGSGVGLGFWQNGRADNFYVSGAPLAVPAPATLALLGLGLIGMRWSRRKQG